MVISLCATLVYTTLIYGAVDTGAITLISISTSLMLTLWAVHSWKQGNFEFYASYLYLPIIGLIVIGVIQLLPLRDVSGLTAELGSQPSSALSLDPYATRFFLIRLVFYLLFFAAALTFINSEKRLRRVAWTIVIFGSLMAFFGILQWLAKPDAIYGIRPTPQAIPFGPFVNQHHFAALMEMTGGMTLGVLLGKGTKPDKRPLLIISLVLMSTSIVLTSSRGGLLSFLGVVFFAVSASYSLRYGKVAAPDATGRTDLSRWLLPVVGAAAAVLIVVGMVLFLGGEQSLLRGAGIQSNQADLTSGRAGFWRIAGQIFLGHPMIGIGFDAFGIAYTKLDPSNGLFRVERAHNDYLQMLADGGIAAFTCVITFVFLLTRKSLTKIKSRIGDTERSIAIGALAGCSGILIHSFFDFPLRTPANAFFFFVLAVLATVRIRNERPGTLG